MELREYLVLARRWARLLVLGAALAAVTAFGIHTAASPGAAYEARSSVLVGPALSGTANSAQMDVARRVAQVYTEIAVSSPVLERADRRLGLGLDAVELRGLVSAATPQDPPLITITAVAADRETAAAIANGIVGELIAMAPSADADEEETRAFLQRQADAIGEEIRTLVPEAERLAELPTRNETQEERLVALQQRLSDLRQTYAALVSASPVSASNTLTVIEPARADTAVRIPSGRLFVTILAGVLGLIVAALVAYLMEKLDDRVRDSETLRRATGLRTLGKIGRLQRPRGGGAMLARISGGDQMEQFRNLRMSIEAGVREPLRSLLVTSATRGEGRTTVAARLAVAFAEAGRYVLLVDADLRQPSLHEQFGISPGSGLVDILTTVNMPLEFYAHRTDFPNLRIITSGGSLVDAPPPAWSSNVRDLILRLTDTTADLVILDAPPLEGASETAALASFIDATVVVVAIGRTRLSDVQGARDTLIRVKARIAGAVGNHIPRRVEVVRQRKASRNAGRVMARPGDELSGR